MRINYDCVRDILLAVEAIPYDGYLRFIDLAEKLNMYSEDDLQYCCLILREEMYIKSVTKRLGTKMKVVILKDITSKGRDFLDAIRDDSAWAKFKKTLSATGNTAIYSSISALASAAIKHLTS